MSWWSELALRVHALGEALRGVVLAWRRRAAEEDTILRDFVLWAGEYAEELELEGRLRQERARTKAIVAQADLQAKGVRPWGIADGVTLWSADGVVELFRSPEAALRAMGWGVIITIDGRVFVEPWG